MLNSATDKEIELQDIIQLIDAKINYLSQLKESPKDLNDDELEDYFKKIAPSIYSLAKKSYTSGFKKLFFSEEYFSSLNPDLKLYTDIKQDILKFINQENSTNLFVLISYLEKLQEEFTKGRKVLLIPLSLILFGTIEKKVIDEWIETVGGPYIFNKISLMLNQYACKYLKDFEETQNTIKCTHEKKYNYSFECKPALLNGIQGCLAENEKQISSINDKTAFTNYNKKLSALKVSLSDSRKTLDRFNSTTPPFSKLAKHAKHLNEIKRGIINLKTKIEIHLQEAKKKQEILPTKTEINNDCSSEANKISPESTIPPVGFQPAVLVIDGIDNQINTNSSSQVFFRQENRNETEVKNQKTDEKAKPDNSAQVEFLADSIDKLKIQEDYEALTYKNNSNLLHSFKNKAITEQKKLKCNSSLSGLNNVKSLAQRLSKYKELLIRLFSNESKHGKFTEEELMRLVSKCGGKIQNGSGSRKTIIINNIASETLSPSKITIHTQHGTTDKFLPANCVKNYIWVLQKAGMTPQLLWPEEYTHEKPVLYEVHCK